jgi:Tol biopolymer transport system component
VRDIFVKDLTTGTVTRVSTDSDGLETDLGSSREVLSPDGTKLLFQSSVDDLVDGDTNGKKDVFIKDLLTGEITRVSTASDRSEVDGHSYAANFSPDGTMIVFSSSATDLVDDDTNGLKDVFIKDLTTGAVTRISVDEDGDEATSGFPPSSNGNSSYFSPDGTMVLFEVTSNLGGSI